MTVVLPTIAAKSRRGAAALYLIMARRRLKRQDVIRKRLDNERRLRRRRRPSFACSRGWRGREELCRELMVVGSVPHSTNTCCMATNRRLRKSSECRRRPSRISSIGSGTTRVAQNLCWVSDRVAQLKLFLIYKLGLLIRIFFFSLQRGPRPTHVGKPRVELKRM